jgi:hypothetical protein
VFAEVLPLLEERLSEFLERLCLTVSAGYGRAKRLSVFLELLHELEEHLSQFVERLCLTASAGYGRTERLSVFPEVLHEFLECLCSTASAGYGRAERLSAFQEVLHELEGHLSEFLERLCLTASAGHGRAERLSVFQEVLRELEGHLSEFLERLCLTTPAGYGRAERLSVLPEILHEFEDHLEEFLEVLYPFLATLSLFLASRQHERAVVAQVAPTRVGHRADPELNTASGGGFVERGRGHAVARVRTSGTTADCSARRSTSECQCEVEVVELNQFTGSSYTQIIVPIGKRATHAHPPELLVSLLFQPVS